jgi:hypothetical protein
MSARFIIQCSGYHENGRKTDKKYLILNIDGDVTMDRILLEIEATKCFSVFRRNKEIDIHHIQAF